MTWFLLAFALALTNEEEETAEAMQEAAAIGGQAVSDLEWNEWLATRYEMFGSGRPTGFVPTAEILMVSDQQVKFLGGERTSVQSLTLDANVDVALRPIALDLFGFAPNRVIRWGIAQFRERHPDRPVTVVDGGDMVDLGCRKELWMAVHQPDPGPPQPVMLVPGNHDLTYAGTLRKDTDVFGVSVLFGNFKRVTWGPSCGAGLDGQDSSVERWDKRLANEMAVILEKDSYTAFWSEWYGGVESVELRGFSKHKATLSDGSKLDVSSPEFLEAVWTLSDDEQVATAHIRMAGECEGAPGLFCREAGRAHMILSAVRLAPGLEYWVLGLDGTDQLDRNPPMPGRWGNFSRLQAATWHSFMDWRRSESVATHPARFVTLNHFPMDDLRPRRQWKRSGMDEVLGSDDVIAALAGHTHEADVRPLSHETNPAVFRKRMRPLAEYVAGSTLDHPASGLRLALAPQLLNNQEMMRPVVHDVRLGDLPSPREEVGWELALHRHGFASYRSVSARIHNWRWRRLLSKGTVAGGMRRALLSRWLIERDDVRVVMTHQMEEVVGLLDSVVRLIDDDPLTRDNERLARLAELRDEVGLRLQRWQEAAPVRDNRKDFRRDAAPLDLFEFACPAALDIVPPNQHFPSSRNCMEAVGYLLREIPEESLAFEFMLWSSVEAAREEMCSGLPEDADVPEECEGDWHLGPLAPVR